MQGDMHYPSGAEFAFTILDDTDDTTVNNGRPVYELFTALGIRTTKTVWSFDTTPENRGPYFAGETLSSAEYLKWVHELADDGYEIAFHNATMGSSLRQDTIKALDFIEQEFGLPVRLHCNHGQNRENLYWGPDRYDSYILKKALSFIDKYRSKRIYEGDKKGSPYYWSDIAAERLSYMRAFAYRQLNGAKIPLARPYRDLAKQPSPLFFNTTDAPDILSFNKLVNPDSIDRLRRQRGWAIISTHLGKGFYWKDKLNPEFKQSMEYLASLPGWFVPVSQLLDFLKEQKGVADVSGLLRAKMEYAHIIDRVKGKVFDSSFY